MNQQTKLMLLGGATVGGLFLAHRSYRTATSLQFEIRPKLPKFSGAAITLTFDIVLKNPTAGSLSFRYPMIQASYKGTALANSPRKDQRITLKPYGSVLIRDFQLKISLGGLAFAALDVFQLLAGKIEAMPVDIDLITRPYLMGMEIPFEVKMRKTLSIPSPKNHAS